MRHLIVSVALLLLLIATLIVADKGTNDQKLRVCFVEGRGKYRKANKHCPTLERQSNIQCVLGNDRLDCLRRIHKGTAHFGVFSSEDLVAARWANIEILITSEMRFHNTPFEYEIVAVVSNEANIHSVNDLQGARFCHPGHGLQESHLTEILANYFESTLVARQCESNMSLIESRIKASAEFFGPSCKAGPWVPDPEQDRVLKRKYRQLCDICYDPQSCSTNDKYWGRRGPLYCLSDGNGDVTWARLDDVRSHFGYSGIPQQADPSAYSYLCPDGHLQPLSVVRPCVWVAKPWPAIAASRQQAERVQRLVAGLTHDADGSWQNALLSLLESYHVNVTTLDATVVIDDYLNQAVGFQSAYSFPECSPPRTIVFCTTSLIEQIKCTWLHEAAAVYGVEPSIQCVRSDSVPFCMLAVQNGKADALMVDQDQRMQAQSAYDLRPLMYEYSMASAERHVTVAVVSTFAGHTMADLRGRRACFGGAYGGAAFASVWETLRNASLIAGNDDCTASSSVQRYFAEDSCWGEGGEQRPDCTHTYAGDLGALRCLADGRADVAFVDLNAFDALTAGTLNEDWVAKFGEVRLLCPFGLPTHHNGDRCYLHWTPRSHLMVRASVEQLRRDEMHNALREMDKLFGKKYQMPTSVFTMFGTFDQRQNVLFRNGTDGLRSLPEMQRIDRWPRLAEQAMVAYAKLEDVGRKECSRNGAFSIRASSVQGTVTMLASAGVVILSCGARIF